MHYRKKTRINRRVLYKGYHIVKQETGRYHIYDGLLVFIRSESRLMDAQRAIDDIFKKRYKASRMRNAAT